MNIFEDLIEELKEENLLEQTVIETNAATAVVETPAAKTTDTKKSELLAEGREAKVSPKAGADFSADFSAETSEHKNDEIDYYRKRAMEEVSFLQMVEYVFAGVEREQLKITPQPYDELESKKFLHSFLQMAHAANTPEHAQAQIQFLRETENWHSSLSLRDGRVLTAHLRRFCETSRPPLSSPALIALARFYRNSSYSEAVRSKFDLVMTRLFSKETGVNTRETLLKGEELIKQITALYADWSSVSLYPTETDDAKISEINGEFESFMREADAANNFDELINANFFNRLHSFKKSTNENFFAPIIAAIAVESNVRIGNRYVELLETEKKKGNFVNLKNKYGFAHDQTISETTGKTFALIELLNQKSVADAPPVEKKAVVRSSSSSELAPTREKVEPAREIRIAEFHVAEPQSRKWLIPLVVTAAVLLLIVYFAVSSSSVEEDTSKKPTQLSVPKIKLEDSMLKDYLQEANIQYATLHGVVLSTWSQISEEEKRKALAQMIKLGDQKGYTKIYLVDKANKNVASVADGNVVVSE